jgi:prepilin-type processing-associated H-X9-DG protein
MPPSASFGVWTLHYTTFDFGSVTGDFNIPDHVVMTRNGGDVSADRAAGNFKSNTMTFYGHVVVHDVQGAFGMQSGAKGLRGPATLTTDQLAIDGAAKKYVATGNVHYAQGDAMADAQRGRLDDQAHVLYLDGNVHIVRGASKLNADRVSYGTVTGKGHAQAKDGTMEFPGATATPAPKKSAKPTPSPEPSPTAEDVWTVHYTVADFDSVSGDFSIPNHVLITRSSGDVSGDRASGNGKHRIVNLYGHVIVHDLQSTFGVQSAAQTASRGPATLTTDQLAADDIAKTYIATGNVHYTQADTVADADQGQLDDRSNMLHLDGHAHVVQGARTLQADHLAYNTVSGVAHAESAPSHGVIMIFPSGITRSVATPKPIVIKNPLSKKAPQPTPTP